MIEMITVVLGPCRREIKQERNGQLTGKDQTVCSLNPIFLCRSIRQKWETIMQGKE